MRGDARVKAERAAIDFRRRAGRSRRDKRPALVFQQTDVSSRPPRKTGGVVHMRIPQPLPEDSAVSGGFDNNISL